MVAIITYKLPQELSTLYKGKLIFIPDRLSYLLVGDTVNVASRLQGLTKKYETDMIISQATRVGLMTDVCLEKLPATKIRGRANTVEIFALPM